MKAQGGKGGVADGLLGGCLEEPQQGLAGRDIGLVAQQAEQGDLSSASHGRQFRDDGILQRLVSAAKSGKGGIGHRDIGRLKRLGDEGDGGVAVGGADHALECGDANGGRLGVQECLVDARGGGLVAGGGEAVSAFDLGRGEGGLAVGLDAIERPGGLLGADEAQAEQHRGDMLVGDAARQPGERRHGLVVATGAYRADQAREHLPLGRGQGLAKSGGCGFVGDHFQGHAGRMAELLVNQIRGDGGHAIGRANDGQMTQDESFGVGGCLRVLQRRDEPALDDFVLADRGLADFRLDGGQRRPAGAELVRDELFISIAGLLRPRYGGSQQAEDQDSCEYSFHVYHHSLPEMMRQNVICSGRLRSYSRCQGSRLARPSRRWATSSLTKVSVSGFHLSFRPRVMAIWPRWPMLAER